MISYVLQQHGFSLIIVWRSPLNEITNFPMKNKNIVKPHNFILDPTSIHVKFDMFIQNRLDMYIEQIQSSN